MEQSHQIRRMLVLCLGAVYFLAVIGATIYSQTVYVEKLPVVTIIAIDGATVPNSALVEGPNGPLLNYVEQQDGPWGKRYILRQRQVTGSRELDEDHLLVYDIMDLENPIALSVSTEYVYDGMEVRLSDGVSAGSAD